MITYKKISSLPEKFKFRIWFGFKVRQFVTDLGEVKEILQQMMIKAVVKIGVMGATTRIYVAMVHSGMSVHCPVNVQVIVGFFITVTNGDSKEYSNIEFAG